MADTATANYGFVKPELGGSNDTWGAKINDGLDAVDTQLKIQENLAERALAMANGVVINSTTTVPPVSPAQGDVYIVAAAATGAWIGKDGQIAAYSNTSWFFYPPLEGEFIFDQAADKFLYHTGSTWQALLAKRKTGWAVATGTAARTTYATFSASGAAIAPGAAYVQSEAVSVANRLQATEAHVQILSQRLKALIDDLHDTAGHGLIGA